MVGRCGLVGFALLTLTAGVIAVPALTAGAATPTCRGVKATIVGTSDADTIRGTPARDVIVGGGGGDTIYGSGGDDLICGGSNPADPDEDDVVFTEFLNGGAGDDTIDGQDGLEKVNGDSGEDTLYAGSGGGRLDGGTGRDHLYGGSDADSLIGGPGDDIGLGRGGGDIWWDDLCDNIHCTCRTNTGDDVFHGGPGYDDAIGIRGKDRFFGGDDDDLLEGSVGDDLLRGGGGNDTLAPGGGDNIVDGGKGNDAVNYMYERDLDPDSSHCGANVAVTSPLRVDLAAGTARGIGQDSLSSIENVFSGSGDDVIAGDSAANFLNGDDGDDAIHGRGGTDYMDGGDGTDSCTEPAPDVAMRENCES
jgi:Ca2+-binding RTX toxin-like protein